MVFEQEKRTREKKKERKKKEKLKENGGKKMKLFED